MVEKTAWEHLMGEPIASPPGERPMKATVDARFDGSFKQLCEWMQETFKNPDDLRVRVIVGNFPLTNEVISAPEPRYSADAERLVRASNEQLTIAEAEEIIKKARAAVGKTNNKIQGIKALREGTSMGLKDAKDFFESLDPSVPKDDDIPF